jgi:hypothetical protein
VTVRVLAFDSQLHPALLDAFGGWCPANSEDRKDWLSLNRDTVRTLRRIAKKASAHAIQCVAEPATTLIMASAWQNLDKLRGAHYHRRRPQSAGISGVPLANPWVFSNGTATMDAGGREYSDGDGLAYETTDLVRRALSELSSAMEMLLDRVNDVVAEVRHR